jgi:uncharacterized membrane protein
MKGFYYNQFFVFGSFHSWLYIFFNAILISSSDTMFEVGRSVDADKTLVMTFKDLTKGTVRAI